MNTTTATATTATDPFACGDAWSIDEMVANAKLARDPFEVEGLSMDFLLAASDLVRNAA